MAFDKVVDSTELNGYFTNIANAIRTKNGTTNSYTPTQMPNAILAIQTGTSLLAVLNPSGSGPSAGFGTLDLSNESASSGTNYIMRPYGLYQCNFNKVKLNNNTTTIPSNFMAASKALTDFVMGDRVITIGEKAFMQCSYLTNINLSTALIKIDTDAFYNDTYLSQIQLPTNNTLKIMSTAFRGCGLQVLDLPTNIDLTNSSQTFASCRSLTKVKIRCPLLYQRTFYGCTGLTKVWISNNCQTMGHNGNATYSSFVGCSALTDIYCEASSAPSGWGAMWNAIATDGTKATAHFGVTEEQFDAL